jgi:NitT/TauT family transport system substrate-binding protein
MSCKEKNTTTTTTKENSIHLKIIAPKGAPAISQCYIEKTKPSLGKNVTYDITTVQGKDPLISAFTNKDYDIVFAPIDLGAQLYNKGQLDYKLTATITFGNNYLVTKTDEEFNLEYLKNKTITLFGKNSSPDIITRYVLKDVEGITYNYLNSTADTQGLLASNPNEIALVAEPQLTALTKKVDNLKIINIQELYSKKMNVLYYPQASVFIKNDLINNYPKVVEKYLDLLEKSTNKTLTNLLDISNICVELNYGLTKEVLKDAIPRSNIGFGLLDNTNQNLIKYFELILENNPNILNGKMPDENFYYKK